MTERTVLLNPGPVTLSDGVRAALLRGDWCHREHEFAELTRDINSRLLEVYDSNPDTYAAMLLTGSGTAAVEAMIATHAPEKSETLLIANGVYGERMCKMLEQMRRPHQVLQTEWTAPLDLEAVRVHLEANANISHIAAVHHETTTGRLNDISGLGAICKERNVSLLLDSVSAFGAEEVRFSDWNIQALAATANKCLHGVPGISFVISRRDDLERIDAQAGSVYLDLRSYYSAQHGNGFSPFTLSVQCAFALDVALREFTDAGGWAVRQSRYQQIAQRIAEYLNSIGVRLLLEADENSSVMHTYVLPENANYQTFHDSLKNSGFVIYAGQGALSGRIFRIAHMGDIRDEDIDRLLLAMKQALVNE